MSFRRRLGVLLTVAVAAAAPSACDVKRGSFGDSATAQVRITEIRIEGGNGDVVIEPGDRTKVEIRRTVTYRGERPTGHTHSIEGSVLRLRTSCERRNCSVAYTVRAPRGVRVLGENDSGDLRATGVSTVDFKVESGDIAVREATGAVDVRTDSGGIELVDARGPATLHASAGDIRAFGVRGSALTAQTSSGDLQLELTSAADVRAKTSAGSIRLVVPPGDYRVQTATRSGKVDVRVATNPDGQRLLNLETGSGDIAVNPR